MKTPSLLLATCATFLLTAGLAACSADDGTVNEDPAAENDSTDNDQSELNKKKDAGAKDAATSSAPTWSQIYTSYIGPNTPGHCVKCHSARSPACADKASCYAFLSASGPGLAKSGSSPLAWFGGRMPKDNPAPNAQAKKDIAAWVAAGMKNN